MRLKGIGALNLWLDEADSWVVARYPLADLLRHLQASPAGPFYFLLLKIWMAAFGDSEAALRSLSLAASLALLPVAYAIGARALSPEAGLLGTLLLAVSPVQLYFAQEARMYMLLTLLTACCVLAYLEWRGAESRRRWPALLLYVLFAMLSLYTHYTSILLIAALNLDALLRFIGSRRAGDRLRATGGVGIGEGRAFALWIAAQAAVVLLLLPFILGVDLGLAAGSQAWRGRLGYEGALKSSLMFFLESVHGLYHYAHDLPRAAEEYWRDWDNRLRAASFLEQVVVHPLTLLAIVAALAYPASRGRRGRRDATHPADPLQRGGRLPYVRPLYLCLLLPLAAGALIAVEQALQFTRYLLFVSPFLFLLVAGGLLRMPPRLRTAATVILLGSMAFGVARYWKIPQRDSNYRLVGMMLANEVQQDERVFILPSEVKPALAYYLRHTGIESVGMSREDPVAEKLARAGRSRSWLIIDYRSPLYHASPARLWSVLGKAPVRQKRFEWGGSPGVLVTAVESRRELEAVELGEEIEAGKNPGEGRGAVLDRAPSREDRAPDRRRSG